MMKFKILELEKVALAKVTMKVTQGNGGTIQ